MKRALWPLIAVACLLQACGPNNRPRIPERPGRVDAPYQLESDDDLEAVRERYESLDPKARDRVELRNELAAEYTRRIDKSLEDDSPDLAFRRFGELLSMWRANELNTAAIAPFAPQAHALRKRFSPSGGDIEVAVALMALSVMEPAKAGEYEAEVTEIFNYGDELAIARYGAGARRARPIEILEVAVEILPTRAVVDRLVELYQSRQEAITSSVRRNGLDMPMLQVHGPGVLSSARNIVRVLAQTGRVSEALPAIDELVGIGDDADLRKALKKAIADDDAASWIMLATMFRKSEEDQRAALALCERAIASQPKEALAYIAAGETARDLENRPLAIRYLERGLALDADHEDASESLAALYEEEVSAMAYSDRPNAALAQLEVFETFHAQASRRFETPLEPDLASAYSVMARGLVSLGDLSAANEYLSRSLKLRPNLASLEYLGTIALRQEQYQRAMRYFARALALPEGGLGDQFNRIRIRRLAAETAAAAGDTKQAAELFRGTLVAWVEFLGEYELAPEGEAEALVEMGKVQFQLGDKDDALEYFFSALSKTDGTSSHHADLVSFLVNRHAYEHALDIYLDALGNENVDEFYKIYMSMWLLGEARRIDADDGHHALHFLESREGGLWAHELARYAAGKGERARLESMATTRGRRAELLFYSAILGPESRKPEQARMLLEEVVKGSMVLFFEYEMAKSLLTQN